MISSYLFKYSLINLDPDAMQDSHAFINSLLQKYLKQDIEFIELLNDVRYGPEESEIYQNRIVTAIENDFSGLAVLIMTASKSNKKGLIHELSNHPKFDLRYLDDHIDLENPHSFKHIFDIIEVNSQEFLNERFFKINGGNLFFAITGNKFKIASVIHLQNGIKFEIESPSEYLGLGFAPIYEFVFENENFFKGLKPKMFNDAAGAGAVEFKSFIYKYCGEHVIDFNLIHGSRIIVSYKVIQLLAEDEELIRMLRYHNVKLFCHDSRISDESIAEFRDVINPGY